MVFKKIRAQKISGFRVVGGSGVVFFSNHCTCWSFPNSISFIQKVKTSMYIYIYTLLYIYIFVQIYKYMYMYVYILSGIQTRNPILLLLSK